MQRHLFASCLPLLLFSSLMGVETDVLSQDDTLFQEFGPVHRGQKDAFTNPMADSTSIESMRRGGNGAKADKRTCPNGHTFTLKGGKKRWQPKWKWNFVIQGPGEISDPGGRKGGIYRGKKLVGIYLNPREKGYNKPFVVKNITAETNFKLEGPEQSLCYDVNQIPPCEMNISATGITIPQRFRADGLKADLFAMDKYFGKSLECKK